MGGRPKGIQGSRFSLMLYVFEIFLKKKNKNNAKPGKLRSL